MRLGGSIRASMKLQLDDEVVANRSHGGKVLVVRAYYFNLQQL